MNGDAAVSPENWFKSDEQNLAVGGTITGWLRHDSHNGMVTLVAGRDYRAFWVTGEGKQMQNHEAYLATLIEAQELVVSQTQNERHVPRTKENP